MNAQLRMKLHRELAKGSAKAKIERVPERNVLPVILLLAALVNVFLMAVLG